MKQLSVCMFFLLVSLLSFAGEGNGRDACSRPDAVAEGTFASPLAPSLSFFVQNKTTYSYHDFFGFEGIPIEYTIYLEMEDGKVVDAFGGGVANVQEGDVTYQFLTVNYEWEGVVNDKVSILVRANFTKRTHAMGIYYRKRVTLLAWADITTGQGGMDVKEVVDGS